MLTFSAQILESSFYVDVTNAWVIECSFTKLDDSMIIVWADIVTGQHRLIQCACICCVFLFLAHRLRDIEILPCRDPQVGEQRIRWEIIRLELIRSANPRWNISDVAKDS